MILCLVLVLRQNLQKISWMNYYIDTEDADIKYAARKLTHILDTHMGEYDVEIFNEGMEKPVAKAGIYINNDAKILACGLSYKKKLDFGQHITFVTNDICLKHLASLFFKSVESVDEDHDDYFWEYYDTAYAMYIATNICTLLSFLSKTHDSIAAFKALVFDSSVNQ